MDEWESVSDDELAIECSKRPINEGAWLEFWKRFQPLVQRRVLLGLSKFTGDVRRADLDDIVQTAFIKILENLDRFSPSRGQLRAFVSTLATNVLIDQLRRTKRSKTVALDDVADIPLPMPAEP